MAANKKALVKRLLLAIPGFQALCRFLSRKHVRVLMYHRFSADAGDARRLGAVFFSRHLELIAKHHAVWTPEQHLESLKRTVVAEYCPVVVTIDDGYADVIEVAKPLLDKHAVGATLFVVTDFVAGNMWFWWDRLRYALYAADAGSYDLDCGATQYQLELTNQASRDRAWSSIATDLSRLAPQEVERQLAIFAAQLGVEIPAAAPAEYLAATWAQLQQAASANLSLGAHTKTHPALSRVDERTAAHEIDASRQEITTRTGGCSAVFCYPHGQQEDYSATTVSLVEQLGFGGAYVAFEADGAARSVFELERYSVHDDWDDFRWKLCGAQFLLQRI